MRVIPEIPKAAKQGALSIGNFDGVHAGHQGLIEDLKRLADKVRGPSVAVTFDPPPLKILKPNIAPAILTTAEDKREILKQLGVDEVIILPTTTDLLELTASQFFYSVIVEQFEAKAILEGENFCFGRGREGDVKYLKDLCEQNNIDFQLAVPKQSDGEWISSTRIRNWIQAGQLQQANQALVRNYRISGVVVEGAQRGRTLGFPTANLSNIRQLVPAHGVYVARVVRANRSNSEIQTAMGKPVALHIGPNPTFNDGTPKVEAHVLDFQGDLYGSQIELEIIREVRSVRKFDSKESLLEQLHRDIQEVRESVANAT